jgi:integrase
MLRYLPPWAGTHQSNRELHLASESEKRQWTISAIGVPQQRVNCLSARFFPNPVSSPYLEAAHGADKVDPLFQPVSNNTRGAGRTITPGGVYQMLTKYAASAGIAIEGFGPRALRATAANNALEHHADIAKVQEWLGQANISTTGVYGRRHLHAEDSPTFKVAY